MTRAPRHSLALLGWVVLCEAAGVIGVPFADKPYATTTISCDTGIR